MLIGYGRTSTVEQIAGLDAQVRDLKEAGAEKLFQEQTSSAGPRGALDATLDFARAGDVLLVTKLDRLARSVADLAAIIKRLDDKGVSLRILAMGGGTMDTGTPTGRLTVNMLGAVAQFERELMLERQREGIAKAKGAGRYKGRAPTAMAKAEIVRAMSHAGKRPSVIAREVGIGRASVYRILSNRVSPKEQLSCSAGAGA